MTPENERKIPAILLETGDDPSVSMTDPPVSLESTIRAIGALRLEEASNLLDKPGTQLDATDTSVAPPQK